MSLKSFYEMLPEEIIKARGVSGCAFIPVGPIEWHSFHLPMGTDSIIAEQICMLVAEKVNGVYFRSLDLGTDEQRQEEDLKKWGFDKDDKIFGMNFPELPLVCEYCSMEALKSNTRRRIEFIKDCGFRYAFVVNHHGGRGQNEYLKETCDEFNSKNFKVEYVNSYRFLTLKEEKLSVEYGGHAGVSETTFLMAFRPDLVDLTKIPEGKLSVRQVGIIHGQFYDQPIIHENYNPRNCSKVLADKLRENIISNFSNYIKEQYIQEWR